MSILFDVAISSSSASFLCIPLMFICSSFRLLLFWFVLGVRFWFVLLVIDCGERCVRCEDEVFEAAVCCVWGCGAVGESVLE